MSAYADTADRLRTYQRLTWRNRFVGVLRIAVPILGVVVLVGLLGQIYLSSLGARFGIGHISVTQERVLVDAPQYAGVLDDGSAYRISAVSAEAAIGAPDLIDLLQTTLKVTGPDGVTMDLTADRARLDTINQLVLVAGTTHVVDSTGTTSMFDNSVFDTRAQTLTSQGPVTVNYADGTHIDAKGLIYNSKTMVWTFSGATVTLQSMPGAKKP
jgi:lipopolysaccharide export system protein LptC